MESDFTTMYKCLSSYAFLSSQKNLSSSLNPSEQNKIFALIYFGKIFNSAIQANSYN